MRTRDIQIKLWLNEEEYGVLQQDIERIGLTQSKYLRALIMKRPICEKLPIDYYRMLTELSRIGNNLNQIAAMAHQRGIGLRDIMKAQEIMSTVYQVVQQLELSD